MKKKKKPTKDPCWCYTGESMVCGHCDREYIQIDVRTYRKIDPRIRKVLDSVKRREKAERPEELPG